jgi:hypothetical protein
MPTWLAFFATAPGLSFVLDEFWKGPGSPVLPAVPVEDRQAIIDAARDRITLWGDGDYTLGREEARIAHDAVLVRFLQIEL